MSPDEPPAGGGDHPQATPPAGQPPKGPSAATSAPSPPPPARPVRRRPPAGRLALGLVLVAVGVAWLLDALDVFNFSVLAVLPAALILIGAILLWGARTGRHSGLIALGVVLTVILTIASSFDIRLRGGVGDRTERPATLAEVQREYHLSVGQLIMDFRAVDFSRGPTTVKASVGIGQLTVRVPAGSQQFVVQASGHAGAGEVMIFGRQSDGLDVDLTARSPGFQRFILIGGTNMLTLDLSVGLGQIEVTQ
jgi:hypothetical protein